MIDNRMNHPTFDVSIIIVSYNSMPFILQCIESINKYSENLTLQILVSDNGSSDDTVPSLGKSFPEVLVLKNEKNLGFAAANNRALAFATGRYVLFLNPDIILLEPVFKKMIEFFERHQDAGMLGCKLVNQDGSVQHSFFQTFPTLTNRFLEAVYIEKLFNKSSAQVINTNHKVAAIVGACIFMRRDLILQIGGFDELFFMYCEDIDLSYSVQHLDYNIYFLGTLKLLHYCGASSAKKQSYFEKVLTKESVYKYFLKHHGKIKAVLYKVLMLCASIFRLFILVTVVPLSKAWGACYDFNYRSSLIKYTRVFLWGLGFEKWTKNPG